MKGLSADARRDLPLAAVASATTWLTMLSWRGFSELWGQFLGPLVLVAAVVPATGVLLRAAPVPRKLGVLLHLLIVASLVWLMLGGSLIHPISSSEHLANRVADAWVSAETYQPPIPETVPGIAPLLIPCGVLALLLVDLLACWLRRVPLAGLPLLAVYCVPISVIGDGVPWLVFLFAASGFLVMMFLHESAHINRWGRPLGATSSDSSDPQGFGVRSGASKTSATSVGSAAVVIAVLLPVLIPTLHIDGLGLFGPGGNGGGIKVVNPIVDMRRNLHRGADIPLLTIQTDDPDPSYLRIGVLSVFNGVEWSSGNRAIDSDKTASGLLPYPEQGLSPNVPTVPHNYTVTATTTFDSRWLPTMFPASSVSAIGDWHWDPSTMDFISANNSTTTTGLTWTMSSATPTLSSYQMINSLTAPQDIQEPFTALPSSLPSPVSQLAAKVTQGATSRFQRAVMLQNWFRTGGGFRYSLKNQQGDGDDALLRFLEPGNGGRVGYCEQFASAFAVMARTLDMPARVAIGFLTPTKTGPNRFVYSSHDMHAWPEVYFRGSGWVRFEPTPGTRTGNAPVYTTDKAVKPGKPGDTSNPGGRNATESPSATAKAPHDKNPQTRSSSSGGSHVPWLALLVTVLILVALAGLALVPGAVRRGRRRRRLADGVEEAWAELRDTALDLGVGWPAYRSPHETGHLLAAWFGPDPDGAPLARPPRGRGLAPGAEYSLDQIVASLERVRYARYADDVPGALAEHVQVCIASLEHGSTRGSLRRAHWLPRSLFGGGRRAAARELDREPEAVSAGRVIDHVS